jgi:glycosyltransferase involved in cell wall biosynthesis
VATFTADLAASLNGAGDDVVVAALVDCPSSPAPDVAHQLVQTSEESAQAVAASLSTDVDVVVVEHEFGIFGGEGSAVLQALTDGLTVPYVVTLHTVSETFRPWQVAALAAPLAGAALVFVFSEEAVGLLAAQFSGLADRCVVVPHAAPEALFTPNVINLREQLGVPDSTMVMSTFGLLSPAKGIEHVIAALPEVRRRVGSVVYLVAGRTHPNVVHDAGEQYRSRLEALTRTLGVADVVQFRDWFHDVDELASLLHGTDLFVTPYTDAEQIVSGALSFAIAAGVPFVSTPYRYATGLAARGCGTTVPFDDDDALADALARVLTDDRLRHRMATCAAALSAERSWPEVGRLIHDVLSRVVDDRWAERLLDTPAVGIADRVSVS